MSKMTMSCALVSSANFATFSANALDFKTLGLIKLFLGAYFFFNLAAWSLLNTRQHSCVPFRDLVTAKKRPLFSLT